MKLSLLFIFFCLIFFCFPKSSLAYSYSPSVENIDAEIEVRTDGQIEIEQDITFVSNSNHLYWIIPSSEADNITIRQNNQIIIPTKIERSSDRTVVLWQKKGNDYYQSTVSTIGYQLPTSVELRSNKEFAKLVYLKEPGQNIENINLTVSYPGVFSDFDYRYYAVHGVGTVQEAKSESNQFSYQIKDLSEYGIFTLDFIVSQGTFEIGAWERLRLKVGSLSLQTILLISFVIPLITLFFLFSLYRNHIYTKDIFGSTGYLAHPPSDLSPMEVDVLRRGKLTKKGVGSMLLGLLNKGYLTIVEKPEGIVLGKIKEPGQDLGEDEKMLIEILFKRKELRGGLGEIEEKKKKSVFDELTIKLFKSVSKKVNQKGYFVADSSEVKNRVLKQGILIFFAAIILAVFLLLFFPSSPWLAIAPVSMVLISLAIIRVRHFFTVRSVKGQDELAKWFQFKNYLKDDHPIKGADKSIFLGYLSWAYLFDVSKSWVSKFSQYPLARPKWFASSSYKDEVKDQIFKTIDFIDRVSEEIVGLKSPLA